MPRISGWSQDDFKLLNVAVKNLSVRGERVAQ